MGPHQIALQIRRLRRLDPNVREVAEAGRHAVDRSALGDHAFDHRTRRFHAQPCLGWDADAQAMAGHVDHLRNRQVTPR